MIEYETYGQWVAMRLYPVRAVERDKVAVYIGNIVFFYFHSLPHNTSLTMLSCPQSQTLSPILFSFYFIYLFSQYSVN